MGEAPTFGRLLVTGGAGFIGSCYVRDVLARRDGTRITVLDKLTYAGNEANLAPVRDDPEMAARLPLRPRRHRRSEPSSRRSSPSADAVVNFAAGVARRPLDPRPGGVPARPGSSASTSCSRPAATAPGRPRFLQVSTDEVYGSVDEGHAGRGRRRSPALAVRGGQGGRRAARPELRRDPRPRRGRDPRLEHVWPVSPPREAHPAVHHQRHRRPRLPLYGDGLQRRDWLYVAGPRRRDRLRPPSRRRPARPTTCRAESRRTNREVVAPARASRQAVVAGPRRSRTGPATTGATRWTARSSRALGWRPRTLVRGRPGGDRRLVPSPTRPWWRAARSGDWDGWYERQYGHRLRRRGRAATPCPTRRPADARRRHRRDRAPRRRARRRPSPTRRSPARRTASRWDRAAFDLDAPEASVPRSTATGRRSSSMPRPGPTSTAAPSTRSSRSRRNATATGVLAAACAARAASTSLHGLDQRGVRRDPDATASATDPSDDRSRPATRTAPRRPPAERLATEAYASAAGVAASGSPGRPGCSGRRGATSRARSSTPRSGRGRRRAAARRRRDEWGTPTYTDDVADGDRRSCSPRTRSRASTTSSTGCSRRAPTGRATSSRRAGLEVDDPGRPVLDLGASVRPPRWGVLEPRPAAIGRAAARRGPTRWPTTRRRRARARRGGVRA